MSEGERKDFSRRAVSSKYMEQDGVCGNSQCMNPLDRGFHRHHKDGNHENADYDNLVLLCIECHHAKKGKEGKSAFDAHHDVERQVFGLLEKMIDTAFEGKMSGANMERMLQGFTKMMQISRSEKGIDIGIEYPPAEIKTMLSKRIAEESLEEYLRGVKDGIRMITIHLREEDKE